MFVHKTSKVGILVYIVYQTRIEQEICQKKREGTGINYCYNQSHDSGLKRFRKKWAIFGK